MEIARGATNKMPSVLGWGANCSSNPQQYMGDYVYVEPRQSDELVLQMIGSKLAEIVIEIIKRHRMTTRVTLHHIIFYFSGISEGQFSMNIVGKRAADQNIPGGTVVDTVIVSPVINEFYLNAHSAFQGTAKTPKYSLVADNSQISLDAIEGITYGLCYLHEIVTATVSLPVPLIVADRCAKRGHSVYVANL
ncbi:unnamed protein product [Angiostrongylus costaricensis]|uniref:Piwi domain-containing protein n=1 Tax=Angiostrongylus costaricensis TaxID=334426 RepID=A0A0R3PT08_ANGCS|nr:unnamed protein product [Angiostrongylus costaricensis]